MINNHINYIEFKTTNMAAVKTFYKECFDWKFTDYGPDYVSFEESGLTGGFVKSDDPIINGVLVILYHNDLMVIRDKVIAAGGTISLDIFSFPGGKRFHFIDPAGNELAIWSE